MPNRERKVVIAANKLSKYYSLLTTSDLSQYIAAGGAPTAIQSSAATSAASTSGTRPSDSSLDRDDIILSELINLFLDVSEGAYTTAELLNILSERLGIQGGRSDDETRALQERYQSFFHIVSDAQYAHDMPFPQTMHRLKYTGVSHRPNSPEVTSLLLSNNNQINDNPNNPTKLKPGLSVIVSNTNQISLANKFTNACSLFLNAIPAIEISKAMPYLEVNILVPVKAINNNRLTAPSIYKFLFGGRQVDNGSVLETLSLANQETRSAGSNPDAPTSYTNIGIEAFLMPQTLINADNIDDTQISANPAIDKFRPFLSLKEFSCNETQSFEAYGYQTAKLSFTLHDRSRLSQIAEFVRADLRGGTEILIEFGWCHMEAEQGSSSNIYADIINGMRKRIKFQVTTSSFTFDDNGQVEVNLDLATLGDVGLTTEPSVGDGVNVTDSLQAINRLTERIAVLRTTSRALNPTTSEGQSGGQQRAGGQQQSNSSSREIRGSQILNAAQDIYSNLVLTSEQQQQIREFTASTNQLPSEPELQQISYLLTTLYGNQQGSNGSNRSGGGVANQLRSQIQNQIKAKLDSLPKNNNDPFLISSNDEAAIAAAADRSRIAARRRADAAAAAAEERRMQEEVVATKRANEAVAAQVEEERQIVRRARADRKARLAEQAEREAERLDVAATEVTGF
jgi:hypothetical protein